MLGQPVSMLIPKVVGFRLTGELPDGATATDLVLTITELLRKHGVVGKFVEFYGDGVAAVPLANRATIGNMSPEFGSTCAIFPIDEETLRLPAPHRPPATSRSPWSRRTPRSRASGTTRPASPVLRGARASTCRTVVPSIAGPKRPQDRIALADAKTAFRDALPNYVPEASLDNGLAGTFPASDPVAAGDGHQAVEPGRTSPWRTARRPSVDHGAVVIAAITSCTNTSNPLGHGRRRAAGQEGGGAGPEPQAVGEDLAGAGLQGGHGLLRARRAGALPGQARLQPGRLRLHHLHRQLRPAAARDQRGGQRRTTWRWRRCCRATGTSRAGSTRTSR